MNREQMFYIFRRLVHPSLEGTSKHPTLAFPAMVRRLLKPVSRVVRALPNSRPHRATLDGRSAHAGITRISTSFFI